MTERAELMCPHCGWRYPVGRGRGLVPGHAVRGYRTGMYCPGSAQNPRNPESDRRPLWKDLPGGRAPAAPPASAEGLPEESVFVLAERLCDQWERTAPLPPDARHLLRELVRRVVLDAARLCDLRALPEGKPVGYRNEARKCGASVRHFLLCAEGENVCLRCDGEGCERCRHTGLYRPEAS